MAQYTVRYLKPTADERDFRWWDVAERLVTSDLRLEGSFAVDYSSSSQINYYHESRVLEIEVKLLEEEKQRLLNKYRGTAKKGVVYYLSIKVDETTGVIKNKQDIGDNPYGHEVMILDIGEHWIEMCDYSWKKKIIVPTCKIIGMLVNNG